MEIINKYKNNPLSNYDILELVQNKCNILTYSEIHKLKSIDELLDPYDACIILFEAEPSYGHWCALIKINNKDVEFFNPYGGYPDDSLKIIDKKFRKQSKQDKPYLSLLLLKSPYDLSYNEYKFQKSGSSIQTCGRHCVLRVIFKNLDLKQYREFMNELSNILHMDYDNIVTLLTMYIHDK